MDTGVEKSLTNFASEWQSKEYESALESLTMGFKGLSSAMTDCGVGQIAHLLDAASLAIKFGKISKKLDDIDTLIIGSGIVGLCSAIEILKKNHDFSTIFIQF